MFTRTAHTAVTPPPYTNRTLLSYAPSCLYLLDCVYKHLRQHMMKHNLIQLKQSMCLVSKLYSVMMYLCSINICWIPIHIGKWVFQYKCFYFLLIHIFVHYNYSTNFICFCYYYFLLVSYEFDSLYLIAFCVKCLLCSFS